MSKKQSVVAVVPKTRRPRKETYEMRALCDVTRVQKRVKREDVYPTTTRLAPLGTKPTPASNPHTHILPRNPPSASLSSSSSMYVVHNHRRLHHHRHRAVARCAHRERSDTFGSVQSREPRGPNNNKKVRSTLPDLPTACCDWLLDIRSRLEREMHSGRPAHPPQP